MKLLFYSGAAVLIFAAFFFAALTVWFLIRIGPSLAEMGMLAGSILCGYVAFRITRKAPVTQRVR